MTDVETIAKSLTKAQREAVLGKRWRWMTLRLALEWPMAGTVERMPEAPAFWQATKLGLAVRAHIQGSSHEG